MPGAAVSNGKIYVMGGLPNDSRRAVRVVEVYDPATDTWTDLEVGFPNVEEYDPATDTWTRRKDIPIPRGHHASAVADGKIYVFGGVSWDEQRVVSEVNVYDPATDTWERSPDIPTPRFGLSASTVEGKIYTIGGFDGSNGFKLNRWNNVAIVEAYDPPHR